jgi:hypothetical protein
MTVGEAWPDCGITVTWKFAPASAELLTAPVLLPFWFELTVTSVRRPITAEGLTTNTLPLPLEVLIPAMALPMHGWLVVLHVLVPSGLSVQLYSHCIPPLMLPLESITHAVTLPGVVP